jgi:hypothetical protein
LQGPFEGKPRSRIPAVRGGHYARFADQSAVCIETEAYDDTCILARAASSFVARVTPAMFLEDVVANDSGDVRFYDHLLALLCAFGRR